MSLIDPGAEAPEFTLPDQESTMHALSDYAGRPVVLYFYPKDDTPGCTREACAFRDLLPDFRSLDAAVLGISPDSPERHARFAARYELPFTLLADVPPQKKAAPPVCDAYGVWQEKISYGRTSMGIVRTTYLIGPDGTVTRRWDRVKVDGHAEAVLEALRECRAST